MCPAEIIAPLVQEGTRNRLQMTPKQTPGPQSPPAPAWLFSISPTSLFLTLCRGMEAAKRGGSQIVPRCTAQWSPEQGGRSWQWVTLGRRSSSSSPHVTALQVCSATTGRYFHHPFLQPSWCLRAARESALFAFLPQHWGLCELDEWSQNDLMQRRIRKRAMGGS